ncbi:cytosine-specific methyltransferase [Planctomycetales bacterium]|nr:cytosine-specific methyltransferase [Planctomycetales bacterium]GHT06776.1 cytosine-specific methyltransferase [Planctomycetales bacterium]
MSKWLQNSDFFNPNGVVRLAELFCGAGGIGLGAALAETDGLNIEHIWATDYDQDACDTYQQNLKPQAVICEDIRKLDLVKLRKKYGDIDCLTFGFPCNDFSCVGEQKGLRGIFGVLYEYCAIALRIFKPKYFIAENVSGLRNANDGKAFSSVLDAFGAVGYTLYPNLYCFESYGVPQKRHRVIIVGVRNDVEIKFAVPSNKPFAIIDNSVKTALADIPDDAANNELTAQSPIVVERLKHIKEGENAFTANLPPELRLNVKGAKISQIYKRLKSGEPAYTITGSGGGGTHVYHFRENRALTNRERARLQTFPDDFVFSGSKESIRKQIGMAVPPQGMKIIFEALLNCIAGNRYETIEAKI